MKAPLFCFLTLVLFSFGGMAQDKEAPVSDDDLLLLDDDADDEKTDPEKPKSPIGFAGLVAIGEASEALADQVSAGIIKELKDGPFVLVPMAAAKSSGKPFDETLGSASKKAAEKSLASGQKLLKAQQFGKAKKRIERALSEFAKSSAALESIDDVIAAHIGLAEIAARLGQEDASALALRDVAQLNPEYVPDSTLYPAPFIRAFEKARDEALAAPTASLSIDATAAGARVIVDGRELGKAPMTITGLIPGVHYVRVYREGLGLFGEKIELKSSESKSLSPGFTDLSAKGPTDLLKLNKFSGEAARVVAEVAREKKFLGAIVGVISKREQIVPTAFIYIDAKSATVRRIGPLDFDADLLNLAIEGVRLQNEVAEAMKGESLGAEAGTALVPGVKAGSELKGKEVALRFDVKKSKKKKRKKKKRRNGVGEDNGDRKVASGGRSRGASLAEDDDNALLQGDPNDKKTKRGTLDEDLPLVEQPWFLPAVIGGGVAGVVLLSGTTYVGLVAANVLPDPRPASGARVKIIVP